MGKNLWVVFAGWGSTESVARSLIQDLERYCQHQFLPSRSRISHFLVTPRSVAALFVFRVPRLGYDMIHKMRVLFLNPPFHPRFSREQRSPAVTKSGTLYYPKWLATAAGVAIQNGHEVDLVDSPAAGYSVQAVIDRIAAKNIQAVVCDTSTPSILNDVSVIESLVAAHPSLHVLMVGRHVSALPKETLAMSPAIEAVAIREYEYTVRDWLAAKACGADLSAIEGLVWRRKSGEIVTNAPR